MEFLNRIVFTILCAKLLVAVLLPAESNKENSPQVDRSNSDVRTGGWIVGEIRAFAFGADDPTLIRTLAATGWVECAGQQIDRKDFPEAVSVLNDTWGSPGTDGAKVYLPDLRGLVLRGWNHGRRAPEKYPFSPYTGDTDLESRVFPRPELLDRPQPGIAGPTDPKTKLIVKDHVGTMQPEQFHGHRHTFSVEGVNGTIHSRRDETSSDSFSGEPLRVGSSTGFTGGNETHPPNVYVLYLIYLGKPAYRLALSGENLR